MFQTVLLTRFVRIGVLLMAFCLAPSAMSATAAPATAPAVVMLGGEVSHPHHTGCFCASQVAAGHRAGQ